MADIFETAKKARPNIFDVADSKPPSVMDQLGELNKQGVQAVVFDKAGPRPRNDFEERDVQEQHQVKVAEEVRADRAKSPDLRQHDEALYGREPFHGAAAREYLRDLGRIQDETPEPPKMGKLAATVVKLGGPGAKFLSRVTPLKDIEDKDYAGVQGEAARAMPGLGGRLVSAVGELAPALIARRPLTLGAYSAVQAPEGEGVKGFVTGMALGKAGQLASKVIARNPLLMKLPERLHSVVDNVTQNIVIGAAGRGGDFSEADVDGIVGVVMGLALKNHGITQERLYAEAIQKVQAQRAARAEERFASRDLNEYLDSKRPGSPLENSTKPPPLSRALTKQEAGEVIAKAVEEGVVALPDVVSKTVADALKAGKPLDEALALPRPPGQEGYSPDTSNLDPAVKDLVDRTQAEIGPTVSSGTKPEPWTLALDLKTGKPVRVTAQDVAAPRPPEKTASGDPEGTSIKNRIVNAEREARGLEPIPKPEPETFEGWRDEAQRQMAENPNLASRLVDELSKGDRPHTKVEAAIINIHKVNLNKELLASDAEGVAARARGDEAGAAAAAERGRKIQAEYRNAADIASEASGTEAGRSLASRKMEMAQDYSLIKIKNDIMREQNYEPLSREQDAQAAKLAAEVERLTGERDALQKRVLEIEAKRAVGEFVRKPTKYGESNRGVTRDAYERTLASLRSRLTQLNAGIDPAMLKDLVVVGAFHVEAGARNFARWSKKMKEALGDKVTPHLKAIWSETQKQAPKDPDRKPLNDAGKIAEMLVADGVKNREALINEVHDILKLEDPSLTREAVMDAISGYGKMRALDKDPVKVELRELKGQMQQIAKLRDISAGKRPARSGIERQPPGDVQRELIQYVNEAKKKHTDLPLESAKKALRNQIMSLDRQISTRAKDPERRTSLVLDAEAKALREQRNALKKEFDAIFGGRGMTEAQRIDAAIKATERSIATYEKMIQTGEVDAKQRPAGPTNPKLDALRARRDALLEQVEDLRNAKRPHKTPEEIAIQSAMTRAKNRAADLMEQLATGNFKKRERTHFERPKELLALDAKLAQVQRQVHEAVFEAQLKQRTKVQKAVSAVVQTGHLARAIQVGIDFGYLGRQALFFAATHPVQAGKAIGAGVRAMGNPFSRGREGNILKRMGASGRENEAQIYAKMHADPAYQKYRRWGLSLTGHADPTMRSVEDAYNSRWGDKIPVISGLQRGSLAFLNQMRFNMMKLFDTANPGLTHEEGKVLAAFVNSGTGRGGGERFAGAYEGAAKILFSPRLLMSRIDLLTGKPFRGGSMRTKKVAAKEYAKFAITMGAVYTLAQLAGGEVETDARSSDFLKVKIGKTRLDVLGGMAQVMTLAMREIKGEKKTTDGKIVPIRGPNRPYTGDTGWDVAARFVRTKLAPLPGAIMDVVSGENLVGEERDVGSALAHLAVPLSMNDIKEAIKEHGFPKGAALGLLSLFGVGLQTYEDRKARK